MGSIALDSKLSMSPLRHEAAGGASTNPTPSEAGSSNQASTIYEEGSEMCAAAASGNTELLREILELQHKCQPPVLPSKARSQTEQ